MNIRIFSTKFLKEGFLMKISFNEKYVDINVWQ